MLFYCSAQLIVGLGWGRSSWVEPTAVFAHARAQIEVPLDGRLLKCSEVVTNPESAKKTCWVFSKDVLVPVHVCITFCLTSDPDFSRSISREGFNSLVRVHHLPSLTWDFFGGENKFDQENPYNKVLYVVNS